MTREELLAFTHGVRNQRQHMRMSQRALAKSVQNQGVQFSTTAVSNAETVPGRFVLFERPAVRMALSQTLGLPESRLIELGQAYLSAYGCIPCRSWGGQSQSCVRHR